MAEKKQQKIKTQSVYISGSDTSKDEVSQNLCTSQEERLYGTIKGLAQVTQAALAHTMAQCNPMVERDHQSSQRLRNFQKTRHRKKQRKPKIRTSHCDILTLFSNILCFIYQNIFVTLFRRLYLYPK